MSSTTAEQRSSYAALGLLVVRRLVPPDLCDYFTRYLALLGTIGRLAADPHVAGAQGIHGDAAFDTLLDAPMQVIDSFTPEAVLAAVDRS